MPGRRNPQDRSFIERPQIGLGRDRHRNFRIVDRNSAEAIRHVARHCDCLRTDLAKFVAVDALSYGGRIFEHVAGSGRKPERKSALKEKRGKNRNEHRWNRSDCRKQGNEADVKPAASEAPAFRPLNRKPAGIERHEGDRRKQDCNQKKCDEWRKKKGSSLAAPPQDQDAEAQHRNQKHKDECRNWS